MQDIIKSPKKRKHKMDAKAESSVLVLKGTKKNVVEENGSSNSSENPTKKTKKRNVAASPTPKAPINPTKSTVLQKNFSLAGNVPSPKKKKHKARKDEPIAMDLDVASALVSKKEHNNILETISEHSAVENTMEVMKKNKTKPPSSEPQPLDSKKQSLQESTRMLTEEEIAQRYPVLKNELLIKKFLSVSMTNNQKGRIRTVLRDILKGNSSALLPDIIHSKIETILRSSENLNDSDLRKVRILYNMLKTATVALKSSVTSEPKEEKKKKAKRYVVFVGNLPPDIDKDQILAHFSDMKDNIRDVRIPHRPEGKKSAIAYLEVANEPAYEMALSKHHTMLGSKRINVLYTTQKSSKISKAQAKGKSAKLIALSKSGQLFGSTALKKKRSHRRAKLKQARKLEELNRS